MTIVGARWLVVAMLCISQSNPSIPCATLFVRSLDVSLGCARLA